MMDLFSLLPSIRRDFLGWDSPALPEAVQRLRQRYRRQTSEVSRTSEVLDLGKVIVVVPGQRAGRRLLELLALLADDERLLLTPPQVVTEGRLPEMLYEPKLPFATDLVQDLVWAQALQELPAVRRTRIVPQAPAAGEHRRWLDLGQVVRRLHTELAADALDFQDVLNKGPRLADFNETARWQALAELQERYHLLLDKQSLWDIQTARLKAIEFEEIRSDCDIILLGTVDLNSTLRQMLEQVADRVTAYIFAPEEISDRFDEHGCLKPEAWREAPIPLRDDQLRQVDGPQDQADAVSEWLAEVAPRRRCDDVVIGAADEALVPQLQRQLRQHGVEARWVEDVKLAKTAPYRLLEAAVKFADRRRYEDLAALVRHSDLDDWLGNQESGVRNQESEAKPQVERSESWGSSDPRAQSLPAQFDRYYNERLPSRISAAQVQPGAAEWPELATALERIEGWLASATGLHILQEWASIFRDLLGAVYGKRVLKLDEHADETLHRTLSKMLAACEEVASVPEALDTAVLSAVDAFHFVLGPLANEPLPPPADPLAVEILGWLELPLDDAPALVVTSFNEGFVPKSAGADAFLPDRLRRELQVLHNDRRYARDAYAACVLCHGREDFRVIFARRDPQNDPLHPSRLLFACSDEQLVARAGRFFGENQAPPAPRRLLLAPRGKGIPAKSGVDVPPPRPPYGKRERISVTRFKDYLACPYRYYLRHVRNLEVLDDAARELDGRAFGSLLHRVLGEFGRNVRGPRQSTRADDIFAYLVERLERAATGMFGSTQRRPAIRLQLEQACQRLRAFSACQAALAQEGWRILRAEDEESGEIVVDFPSDDKLIALVGRIDRIDWHEATNSIRIIDYKTADKASEPDRTHRQQENWIDLQLPLYRHLWRKFAGASVNEPDRVELGYFNVPKKLDDTGIALAPWDAQLLDDADAVAAWVVRSILAGDFARIERPAPAFSEDFAVICLDRHYEGPDLSDPGQGNGGLE